MKALFTWLREFASLPPDPAGVAERLNHLGLEVEDRFDLEPAMRGVVIAEIRTVERHPKADRLSVCTVFDGHAERRVVCGAENVRARVQGAFAPAGTELPGGKRIERAEIRGVLSEGMLCSEQELGLSAKSAGILLLEGMTVGAPISAALGLSGESLFTVGPTPNRPDWLSHAGIAREAAAVLGVRFALPEVRVPESGAAASERARIDIEDPDRCPRYAARVMEGVRVGPSPAWLRRRLELCGVRAINNVVDATNYVLLELGHPLHAFDLDRVGGARIIVRRAREGERMKTLDGVERTLSADDLVIADAERAQALAGVMGGGDSEVGEGTTRLLLESAYFEPRGIRRTAKRHGMHTEASHRFERGADPEMVVRALDRVAALIAELSGGSVRQKALDLYPRPVRRPSVRLTWRRLGSLLGTSVPPEEAVSLLSRLGIRASAQGDEGGEFEIPSWRPDLHRDVDLIEEVARLRGYDKIPSVLPAIRLSQAPRPRSPQLRMSRAAAHALQACGLWEAANYAFLAPKSIDALRLPAEDRRARPLRLHNPLSEELAVMRTSLLPGLLQNAAHNTHSGVRDVHLYEIGRIFLPAPGQKLPEERLMAAGIRMGKRPGASWDGGAEVDFYDVKGVVQEAMSAMGLSTPVFGSVRAPYLHPRASAGAQLGNAAVALFGELHPQVAASFNLAGRAFVLELDLSALAEQPARETAIEELPRFPPAYRDMAVVVDRAVEWEQIRDLVLQAGDEIRREVQVFDVYTGSPVPEGKKSVAFAITYHVPDRTLTDEEVGRVHERIRRLLEERLGARIRE
jgi:phenylalanyl-tRNA synthetase beta chain